MKNKQKLQISKRLLSLLLVAMMAMSSFQTLTTFASEGDAAISTEAAAEENGNDTNTISAPAENSEAAKEEKAEASESAEIKNENSESISEQLIAESTEESMPDQTEGKTSAESAENDESRVPDESRVSEVESSSGGIMTVQSDTGAEVYGNTSDYAGAWKDSHFKAGTYTVTANLSMPGQYNPVLTGVTVYANNPNNPFGPVLDAKDPATDVQNVAPTTPLSNNATVTVADDGTLTLNLPIKNPVFTTQKIGTASNLAFTAEKLAGPYTYGTASIESRIYKLTATLGKVALSSGNVATYTFKGSELYALPINTWLKPEGNIALQLDVDLTSITKELSATTEFTYTGAEQFCVEDAELYTVESGTASATDAGKYTAELALSEKAKKAGYVWKDSAEDTVNVSWEIKPAELTATYIGETIDDSAKPALTVNVSGFVNNESAEDAEDYTAPTVSAPENLENGKTYELTPEGGTAKNYIFKYVAGNLVVEKNKNLTAGTYSITANLTVKGENNIVLPGVQIYPGTHNFPPILPDENKAKLVVKENGDKYITLDFRPNGSAMDAAEVFTIQSMKDGENIHVTNTVRGAGPGSTEYSQYEDRIVEATFKVDDCSGEYALGACSQWPTLLQTETNMAMHLVVDWDSVSATYVEPGDGESVWTKTFTDAEAGVSVKISTTEKTIGEKLDTAVLDAEKITKGSEFGVIQAAFEPMYEGDFSVNVYDIALNDSDKKAISLSGNTKAEVTFTTEAKKADAYRVNGTVPKEFELQKEVSDGAVSYTVMEKLGRFAIVDSSEAYRWYTREFSDSTTGVNVSLAVTNKENADIGATIKQINYSTKTGATEKGEKIYSFGFGSVIEPLFGPSPQEVWYRGQTKVTVNLPAEENTRFYLVTEYKGMSQIGEELDAEIKDGVATIDILPLDYESDGQQLLDSLYNYTKDQTSSACTYIIATTTELNYASAPMNYTNGNARYLGVEQKGYIDGTNYEVVSGTTEALEVGSYTLVVKPKEGYTWIDGTDSEKTLTWKIDKAILTVTTDKEVYITEPGVLPDLKLTVTGFVNGETAETAEDYVAPDINGQWGNYNKSYLADYGDALKPILGGQAKNYTFSVKQYKVYIPLTEYPEEFKNLEKIYTGKTQVIGVNINHVYEFEETGRVGKDVGSYSVKATLNDDYLAIGGTWPDGTTEAKTFTWKIEPAELTATYAGETIDEDGTPSLNVDVTGFVNNENAQKASDYVAPTITAPENLEAGRTYELTPANGSAKNYKFKYVAGNLVINEKETPVDPVDPVDPSEPDELAPGTYQITANVYLPGELNTQLKGVTAYMTNPNNPVGIGGNTGIPNSPVTDNAKLVVGKDGSRTIVVDLVNPVFTLQKIRSGSNVEVLGATRDNETYSGNTGVSRNGRITTLYLKLKDNSGTYQFGDCTEFPTLLEADWNVPLRMSVDFTSAKKTSDSTEVSIPATNGDPVITPNTTPTPAADSKSNTASQSSVTKNENTVTKLKPGTYTVTANIWFNKADTGLPMNPHITSNVFPPKDPVSNNATLTVDANNHAYVTVPISIQSKVMTVRSISGLNITNMQKNADGAITSITVDLGILENPDAVITKSCNVNIWMGELAMSISGFSKEHSWPATFQLSLKGVATESGVGSADGILGKGTLTSGVQTGDNSNAVLYAVLVAVAAMTAAFTIKRKKQMR